MNTEYPPYTSRLSNSSRSFLLPQTNKRSGSQINYCADHIQGFGCSREMPLRHEGNRILARAELDDVAGCRVGCHQAIPKYEE